MQRPRQIIVGIGFLLLLLSPAANAGTDDREVAREHFVKGSRAFELGAYDEAIREYEAAYRAKDDPALLYNLAQAHRLAGHPTDALRFYRLYLQKVPSAPNREQVLQKTDELSKLLEQQKKAQNLPPDQLRPPTVTTQPKNSVDASTTEATGAPSSPDHVAPEAKLRISVEGSERTDSAVRRRKERMAGIAIGAVGLGLVGTGIAFGVLAQNDGDALTKLNQSKGVFDSSKDSAGRTDQIVEGVTLGLGAAAIVTGVVLYVIGRRSEKSFTRAAFVAPLVGPQSLGATLQGRF